MIHFISSLPAELYFSPPAKQSLNKHLILKNSHFLAELPYHPKINYSQIFIFPHLPPTKLSKFPENKHKEHKFTHTNTYGEVNGRIFGVRYRVWSERKVMKFILNPKSENLCDKFLRS